MMIALVMLILILLFFNQEMFGNPYMCRSNQTCNKYIHNHSAEPFNTDYIKGSFDPEIDNHYMSDRSGRKGIMFNLNPTIIPDVQKNSFGLISDKPVVADQFNGIVKKLELYEHNYW
jgi:hypothetical protein